MPPRAFSSVIRHDFHFTPLQTQASGAQAAVFTNENGSRRLHFTYFDWSKINNGEWHQCVVTYQAGVHEIWIDGTKEAANNFGVFPLWTADDRPWEFGGREPAEGYAEEYYTGELDDVRIYSYALNEKEIKALHDGTAEDVKVATPARKPYHQEPSSE
jgi:hypothetical protein